MRETTLAIGDTLRIDVEGCPPRVLNDYRFPRHANIVSFNKVDRVEYVYIAWPDGWHVAVKRDVAIRMREAYLAENGGYVDIREATAKEVEIFHQLRAAQDAALQPEVERRPYIIDLSSMSDEAIEYLESVKARLQVMKQETHDLRAENRALREVMRRIKSAFHDASIPSDALPVISNLVHGFSYGESKADDE